MTLHCCTVLTPEVEALLALAMWPDPGRVRTTLDAYAQNPELQVWTWTEAERPVCAAGLRGSGRAGALLHLGTQAQDRGQGHARRLLLGLMGQLNLDLLEAETDDDSVGFYRRAGFTVQETAARGHRPRYRCTLTTAPLS